MTCFVLEWAAKTQKQVGWSSTCKTESISPELETSNEKQYLSYSLSSRYINFILRRNVLYVMHVLPTID